MSNGYQKFFKEAQKASKVNVAPKSKAAQQSGSKSHALMAKNIKHAHLGPEQALKMALAERLKERKAEKRAKKAKFPVGSAVTLMLVLAAAAAGSFFPEVLEKYISKVEISFLGSAQAAGSTSGAAKSEKVVQAPAKDAETSAKAEAKAAEPTVTAKTEEIPDTRTWTPEELSFFNKLNERKAELDLKESELTKLEEELQQQKVELELKIQQLDKMRSEISGVLKDKVATDQVKVDKLVQVYSGMKPQQAARVIETINEDLAVEVLDKMKKKSASEILNMMDAKKAQKLSEALAGYRTPATE